MENWESGNLSIRCVPLGLLSVSVNVCVCEDDRRQEWLKEWLFVLSREKWLRETE